MRTESWWVDDRGRRHTVDYAGQFHPHALHPHGFGELCFSNGDRYVGEWRNGQKHGRGNLVLAFNAGLYVGEWEEDLPHGSGRFMYANLKKRLEMLEKQGKRYGWIAGSKGAGGGQYDGEWSQGHKHGTGTIKWSQLGKEFAGELGVAVPSEHLWLRRKFGSGAGGRMSTADGTRRRSLVESARELYVYEGQWENDRRHGHGSYTDADGNAYTGMWREGKLHGNGEWRGVLGDSYDGDFVDNKRHGHGVYEDIYGGRYVGPWECGMKEGWGRYTFSDGVEIEAEWHHDKQRSAGLVLTSKVYHRTRLMERRAPPSEPIRLSGDMEAASLAWMIHWPLISRCELSSAVSVR